MSYPHKFKQQSLTPSSRLYKRDFIFIIIYIALLILMPIIIVFGTLGLTAVITQQPPNDSLFPIALSVSILMAQIIALFIFYRMHQLYIIPLLKFHVTQSRSNQVRWRLIIITLVVIIVLYVIHLLANLSELQDTDLAMTSYTNIMQHSKLAMIIMGLSTIIVKPILDQLIFRYILIQELAKKLPLQLVIAISMVCEVIVQSYHFDTIFDAIAILIIVSGATYLYLSSNYNLIVSYYYQVLIEVFKLVIIVGIL